MSVGGDLIYAITVTNHGPDAVSGVTLTDVLPANATFVSAKFSQGAGLIVSNILTANLGGLAANGSATLTIHVLAGPEEVFVNVVSVIGLEEDPSTNNNEAVSRLTVSPIGSPGSVPKADVSVAQTSAKTLGLRQWLVYTLTVTNAGPYPATEVVLSDLLPANAEFLSATTSQGTAVNSSGTVNTALGTIASGGSATVSIVVHPRAAGTYVNKALLSTGTNDQHADNNASSWTTLVTPDPPTPELLVDVRTSAPSVPVGDQVTYIITVANLGPDPATGVVLTDPLPAGMEFVSAGNGVTAVGRKLTFGIGSLAAGAIANVTAVLRGTGPGNVFNIASATANEGGNTSASSTIAVFDPGPPPVDLAVLSSVSEKFVPVGTKLTYTLVVTNRSSTAATDVLLVNKLPTSVAFVSMTTSRGLVTETNGVITAHLDKVAHDSPVTLIIQTTPTEPDILINRASVSSAEADGDNADNVSFVFAMSEVLITDVEIFGPDIRVSFNSVLGRNYLIQSRPDAVSGIWESVPGTTNAGNDHLLQITMPNANAQAQQFYRVLQLD